MPFGLSEHIVATTRLRMEQAVECVGRSDLLVTDYHAEVAAALGVHLCFFGAVGAWAKAHCSKRMKSAEYIARVSSLVHALLASLLTWLCLLDRYRNDDPWRAKTSCQEGIALAFSAAYFMTDSIGMLTTYFSGLYMLHHIACIGGIGYALLTGDAGHFTTLVVFCLEVTNPFMQVHWLNVSDKRTRGHWYNLNRFGFIIFFTFVRGIIGPWLIYVAYTIALPWYLVALGVGFFVFSMLALIPIIQAEIKGEIWSS